MAYNQDNFFSNTMAAFQRCESPDRPADYESNSGSKYWYGDEGVIRESDHWGTGIASCDWYLDDGWYGVGMMPTTLVETDEPDPWSDHGRYEVRHPYPTSAAPDKDGFEPVSGYCAWADFCDIADSMHNQVVRLLRAGATAPFPRHIEHHTG